MSAHTPGPYTIEDWQILGPDGPIGQVHSKAPGVSPEQATATLRLWASAPELLDALYECLRWATTDAEYHDSGGYFERLTLIRNAIDQATGQ